MMASSTVQSLSPRQPADTVPGTDDDRMQSLCAVHAKALRGYLLRLTFGERQTAEDLLQETLLRAWRNFDRLATDVNTLRPWLFTVARRVAIDHARARKARPAETGLFDVGMVAATDDPIDRMLTERTVRQAFVGLSDPHREVLIELYYRGRTAAEAAASLGIPEGTVKSRAFYALRCLRHALDGSFDRA